MRYLYQRKLHKQTLVAALTIVDVTLISVAQRLIEETRVSFLCLLLVTLTLLRAYFKQRQSTLV
ncbi:hypothetical protein VPJ68_06150, partial [Parabacteroides distasonis]